MYARCPLALASILLASTAGCASHPAAEIVYLNGNVYTVDSRQPRAHAVAVREGRIVYVGDDAGARAFIGGATEVVECEGAAVYPGFTDAHVHLEGVGARELRIDLTGTTGIPDLLRRLRERVDAARAGDWIVGRGWIETGWEPPRFPTRFDLDTVAPENPVLLYRSDGHGAVANGRALALAGITRAAEDPRGGAVLRGEDGEPTGMLTDNAVALVEELIPRAPAAERRRALVAGARIYAERGWTAVQIAGAPAEELADLRALVADGSIPLRVYAALLYADPATPGLAELFSDAARARADGGGTPARVTVRALKVVLDGALGSRGAALLLPYLDAPGAGYLLHGDKELLELFTAALRAGVQVETHAIGDLANRRILDLYERTFALVPPPERAIPEPRWRVEHAQIVDPADLPRFRSLGVIPSMQPSHAISDLHFAPSRIGAERLRGAYAWRSLIEQGSIIAAGSDAPVEVGNPIIEFYAAVARRDLEGYQGPEWYPEQVVSREDALRMLTIWPAFAAFEEEWRGSIEVGKACDLSIFSRDLMTVDTDLILGAKCLMTVVGGKIAYRRPRN